MTYALINATTYDFNEFHENQFIIFEETILNIGSMTEFINHDYQIIDCLNHLVLPSLVVGHTHIYSTFARGLMLPFNPTNFLELLEQLWWKIDRHLDNEMTYYSGIVSSVDYMKNGVTTLIDHHASGTDITGSLNSLKKAVVNDSFLRGIFCFETSDRFDVEKSIRENVSFIHENKSSFSRGLFGLHASLSLSEETLVKVKKQVGDTPIHIHVAESEMDQSNCEKLYQERVIERLDRHGLLNKNSILSHCIYVDDHELDIIKNRGCVIAFNINSNMNNGVGLPDYQRIKEKNIPVIIGNDGISSSITTEYLALYFAMHLKDQSPSVFTLSDIQQIINNTYDYVNEIMKANIGRLKVGYSSDLLTIPYIAPTPLNKDNVLGHLFFGLFNSFKPNHVFSYGNHVVNQYDIDPELTRKYQAAKIVAKQCWENITKENENEFKN